MRRRKPICGCGVLVPIAVGLFLLQPPCVSAATSTTTMTVTLATPTESISLPTTTESKTFTLPTETETFTLPTGTATGTFTLPSSTETDTLPTGTVTATLPTGSETLTLLTTTPTVTMSLPTAAPTFLLDFTATVTRTQTEVLESIEGYTYAMTPESFVEGQEFRATITALTNGTNGTMEFDAFNVSDLDSLQVRVVRFDPATFVGPRSCGDMTVLQEAGEFGLHVSDEPSFERLVSHAHVTLTAPSAAEDFVVCFRHFGPGVAYMKRAKHLWDDTKDEPLWQLFEPQGRYLMKAAESRVWYNLPEATAGQYAIIQLNNDEPWNFTMPASSCAAPAVDGPPCAHGDNLNIRCSGLAPCAHGDNLKIVRRGEPCTYETQSYHGYAYPGSEHVYANGSWKASGLWSLRAGATAGGLARFGTEEQNPLVDEWTTPKVVGDWSYGDEPMQRTYAYVRLPEEIGTQYDVCFSGLQYRTIIGGEGNTPVWRKLFPCSPTSDARTACPKSTAQSALHFTVAAEQVGWSMFDLTPNTWGTVVFDDSGQGGLSSVKADPSSTNYWSPQGGDYMRIVPKGRPLFAETQDAAAWPIPPLGSGPSAGCWSRGLDAPSSQATTAVTFTGHGGWADSGAEYPAGSRDLTGDPTDPTAQHDAAAQAATFTSLWVPRAGPGWYVCYRRTCQGSSCAKNTGMRVLPWHDEQLGSVPRRWLHLGALYQETLLLNPGDYGSSPNDTGFSFPPQVTWYMNDTRSLTWGPLVVEKAAPSDAGTLDSRKWNFARAYATGDTVAATVGSTVRLVGVSQPCEYTSLIPAAENTNGGAVECNSKSAETDTTFCQGSAVDSATTVGVAFYITLPQQGRYRVCFRIGGWNWREVWPTPEGATAWGDANQPSGARQREDWRVLSTTDATNAGGGMDLWLTTTASPLGSGGGEPQMRLVAVEERAEMEALFLITDTRSELSVAERRPCSGGCEDSGDVLRLVPEGQNCDVNPDNWNGALADTHLSLYCARPGTGHVNRSGLYSMTSAIVSPCPREARAPGQSGSLQHICRSSAGLPAPCGVSAADASPLHRILAGTPDLYDDIVPHDSIYYNTGGAAAVIRLPPATDPPSRYKICYKQMATANWVIFNDSWEVTAPSDIAVDVITADQDGRVLSQDPVGQHAMLGGEATRFSVRFPQPIAAVADPAVPPRLLAALYAKVVRPVGAANDNCLSPPAGTESAPYSAQSTRFRVGATVRDAEFWLTVPQAGGRYMLCVQARQWAEDSMSWWRSVPFDVLDSGIRWFVTAGNQPVNLGLSEVSLQRCLPAADGTCGTQGNTDTFDTDPGADGAKIVPAAEMCSPALLPDSERGVPSGAEHVGLEGGGLRGHRDLGPADGPAAVAEMRVTLPAQDDDAEVDYKVCAWTAFHDSRLAAGGRRWVEVAQVATGVPKQVRIFDQYGVLPAFRTGKAHVKHWLLAPALSPPTVLVTGAPAGSVAVAGASTCLVGGPCGAPGSSDGGLTVVAYSAAAVGAADTFKLVAARHPVTRRPAHPDGVGWGDVGERPGGWEWAERASCAGPAVTSTSNGEPCTASDAAAGSSVCPGVHGPTARGGEAKLDITIQLPIEPGQYYVCYRVNSTAGAAQPWRWLPNSGGSFSLYTQPAYLEFSLPSPTAIAVYDVRSIFAQGAVVSLSSWCSGGCASADMLTVVNDTQVCPAPVLASAAPPRWFPLQRASNETATVAEPSFVMPPAGSAAAVFKLCVYKAGQAHASGVTRSGVVYQLWNRGAASGFWSERGAGVAAGLEVVAGVEYNRSAQFIEFDQDTEATYANIPLGAGSSRTPLLRSGTTVEYLVRTVTAAGQPVPYGSHAVDVLRCAAPGNWQGLACADYSAPDVATAAFSVISVDGTCSTRASARYGWPSNGLRQFLQSGALRFRIQYRSSCGGGEFGCGIRFSTTPPGGTQEAIFSKPQWVNIEGHYPDAVAVNGVEAEPQVAGTPFSAAGCSPRSVQCTLVQCSHAAPCRFTVSARFQGPEDFAPLGALSILYSAGDYGHAENTVPPQVFGVGGFFRANSFYEGRDLQWGSGGRAAYASSPLLKDGIDEGFVYFNLTYGSQGQWWTRLVVRVVRPQPTVVVPVAVAPADVPFGLARAREPSPVWVDDRVEGRAAGAAPPWTTQAAEEGANSSRCAVPRCLVARPGSYLDALTPYELEYSPRAGRDPIPPSVGLDKWLLSAALVNAGRNKVLTVLESAEQGGKSPAPTALNYETAPTYTGALLAGQPPRSDQTRFFLRFRLLSSEGCSRFGAAGGCTVRFDLAKGGAVLSLGLHTPVRVAASTLRVTAQGASATARQGVQVTAVPGTPCHTDVCTGGFLPDEFHYGDIFALQHGLDTEDGIINRDGVTVQRDATVPSSCAWSAGTRCAVWQYRPRQLGASTWGARWTILPSKPCTACEFTFHSSWGASPQSFRSAGEGVHSYNFADETIALGCSRGGAAGGGVNGSRALELFHSEGSTETSSFDVSVRALVTVGNAAVSARWPRWWVFHDTTRDTTVVAPGGSLQQYTLRRAGSAEKSTILSARMWEGATATFAGLRLHSAEGPNATVTQMRLISFHAVQPVFSTAHTGAVVASTKTLSCSVRVSVAWAPAPVPTTRMRVVGVDGATAMCSAPEGCNSWYTSISGLRGGISVNTWFYNTSAGDAAPVSDTTPRNLTVVPLGGPASTQLVRFTKSIETNEWTSGEEAVTLDSTKNKAVLDNKNEAVYTYGSIAVRFARVGGAATVLQSRGSVTLKYASELAAEQLPVRETSFQVCGSRWSAGADQTETALCQTLYLWVVPDAATKAVALWTEETAGMKYPGVGPAPEGAEWGYGNPELEWPLIDRRCQGERQSPIDIRPAAVAGEGARTLREATRFAARSGLRLRNSGGRVLEVEGALGSTIYPCSPPACGGAAYSVQRLQLHFPSEHTVDGVVYDGELQIVHQRAGVACADPDSCHGDMLVVSVLFRAGAAGEAAFLSSVGLDGELPGSGNVVQLQGTVNLHGDLQHALAGSFWRYSGSLATPPCAETVTWLVASEPAVISEAQLARVRALFPSGNSRPTQPLYGRPVLRGIFSPAAGAASRRASAMAAWDYRDADARWPQLHAACGGRRQSPVDIVTSAIHSDGGVHLAAITDYRTVTGLSLRDTGHGFQVDGGFGEVSYTVGGELHNFSAVQVHLHFPSEHTVNGQLFAGELHIVHVRQNVSDQELLVVGILLELGDTDDHSPLLDQIGFNGTDLPRETPRPIAGAINLGRNLSAQLAGSFWRYQGSLTTPPCSEVVNWFVAQTTARVSPAQVARFKARYPITNRPVQSLYGRTVAAGVLSPPPVPDPRVCGVAPSLLRFSAVAYYQLEGVGGMRFLVYDSALEFTLRIEGQLLVPAASPSTTNATLTARNSVPAGASLEQRLRTHAPFSPKLWGATRVGANPGVEVGFAFYGLADNIGSATSPVSVLVQARDLDNPGEAIGEGTSLSGYWWRAPSENYTYWALQENGAVYEDECPQKRQMAVHTHGYRTYAPTPGEAWNYRDGAAVGLPFPVQTAVMASQEGGGVGRAWTFPPTFVRVTKRSWSGCNDGGEVKVYSLSPSAEGDAVALRSGLLDSSFRLAVGGSAVLTRQGVATVWPVFSRPCEVCTLMLELCYSSAGSSEQTADLTQCLTPGAAQPPLPGDERPVFPDRTKVTKGFRVAPADAERVQVYQQRLPTAVEDSPHSGAAPVIKVGQVFEVDFESVQLFGAVRWSMRAPGAAAVSVRSVWVDAGALDADQMRYGNGGFLAAPGQGERQSAPGEGCDVTDRELRLAAPGGAASGFPQLRFFFTRPCSQCAVLVTYSLPPAVPSGAPAVQHHFFLRSYAGGPAGSPNLGLPARFRVVTCGRKWLIAGRPPVSVRKRSAFSLTVWKVDATNFPSWDGNQVTTFIPTKDDGNGGGGPVWGTSPPAPAEDAHTIATRSTRGCATVRITVGRACYRCFALFGGEQASVTVLTDPTQVLAVAHSALPRTQHFADQSTRGVWRFDVYAADDLGDRSYTVSGPTAVAFQPQWFVQRLPAGSVSLGAGTPEVRTVASGEGGFLAQSVDLRGSPTAELVNGTRVYNGVPVSDYTRTPPAPNGLGGLLRKFGPGTVSVRLSQQPAADYPLLFSLGPALPTHYFGGKLQPTVDFTVAATQVAVADDCTGTFAQGQNCTFEVFAVGQAPGALESAAWVRSVLPVSGAVSVSADCGQCGVSFSPASTAGFKRGRASFTVSFDLAPAASCTCAVTVQPPPGMAAATAQTFSVSFASTELTRWLYAPSANFAPAGDGAVALAHAAAERTHDLRLRCYNSQLTVTGLGGITWPTPAAVTVDPAAMRPPGCFVCGSPDSAAADANSCLVTVAASDDIAIRGHFPAVGDCEIPQTAIQGLPQQGAAAAPASPDERLTVTVRRPFGIETVTQQQGLDVSNFTALDGLTPLWMPAAIVGRGSELHLRVVDDTGQTVLGDFHTTFFLYGTRADTGEQYPGQTAVASAGMAKFHIDQTRAQNAAWEPAGGGGAARRPVRPLQQTQPAGFSYADPDLDWRKTEPLCAGPEQSPIDIDPRVVSATGSTPLLPAVRYASGVGALGASMANTGGGISVRGNFGTVGVGGRTYDALEIRFHFPSEHSVAGVPRDGEMQVVHQRQGACGEGGALSCTADILIISVFLARGREGGTYPGALLLDSMGWPAAAEGFPAAGRSVPIGSGNLSTPVDLRTALVESLGGAYWRYDGSLTTPPCTEGVKWFVTQRPLTVRAAQIAAFKGLYPDPANNRPLQPLQGRQVALNMLDVPKQSATQEWDYNAPGQEWPLLPWAHCGGRSQSPIDVQTAAVAATGGHRMSEVVTFRELPPGLPVLNTGHEVKVSGEFGHTMSAGARFDAVQFHFHFPSEHTVNGQAYAGELHIVHTREGSDELLVIGVLIEESPTEPSNPLFAALGFGQLPAASGQSRPAPAAVDLAGFLQLALGGSFWRYQGSLTTPPCSEVVRWHLLQNPIAISKSMADAYRAVFTHGNARPVQPLYGRRVVLGSFELSAGADAEWSYADPDGEWPKVDRQCAGRSQSPISISTARMAAVAQGSLGSLLELSESGSSLEHEGHTLRIEGSEGKLTLGEDEYELDDIDFRFPSEHAVDGSLRAGEIQLRFQKDDSAGDRDVVYVSVLVEQGPDPNPFLTTLGFDAEAGLPAEEGAEKDVPRANLGEVLSEQLAGTYWRYEGSLTRPPCSETVGWFVAARPLGASARQVQSFKALFPDPANNRPVQPLQGRLVVRGTPEVPSASAHDQGWYFSVRALSPTVGGLIDPFDSVAAVGPLRFVRKAARLQVEVRLGESAPYAVPSGQPWVEGYPFSMRISVLDHTGETLTGEYAAGSDASLILRPAAVPCREADLWSQMLDASGDSGCTQFPGSGGSCKAIPIDKLSACGNNGLRLYEKSDSLEVGVEDGRAELQRVIYSGKSDGVVQFMLTTQEFGPVRAAGGSWEWLPSDGVVGALNLQLISGIAVTGPGADCRYRKEGTKPADWGVVCALPSDFGSNALPPPAPPGPATPPPSAAGGQGRRAAGLQTLAPAPPVSAPPPVERKTIELGRALQLSLAVLDSRGGVVLGDSSSKIQVQSQCLDPGANSFVGRLTEVTPGTVDDDALVGGIDVVSPLIFAVRGGAALAGGLHFSGPCENMTLSFRCISGPLDTEGHCGSLPRVRTEPFRVALPAGMTLAPPAPPPPPLRYLMKLRSMDPQPTAADARRAFRSFADGMDAAAFNAQLGSVLRNSVQQVESVTLDHVCGIPSARSAAGPTAADKSPEGAPDGGTCVSFQDAAAAAEAARLAHALQTDVTLEVLADFVVAFDPQAAGVSPHALRDGVNAAIENDIRGGTAVTAFAAIPPGSIVMSSQFEGAVVPSPAPTPAPSPAPPVSSTGTGGTFAPSQATGGGVGTPSVAPTVAVQIVSPAATAAPTAAALFAAAAAAIYHTF